jgi:hypothetical protein
VAGADPAIRPSDAMQTLFAFFAKKNSWRLGMSASNAIRGIEQFDERITHAPNRIRHVNKLTRLEARGTA